MGMAPGDRTMKQRSRQYDRERGTILLVVVFIATAVAGLAAISAARVVTETKRQRSLEDETRAISSAYAQINMAMNVVNNAEYNLMNHNLELRAAIDGLYGGTASELQTVTTTEAPPSPGGEESGYLTDETKNGEVRLLPLAGPALESLRERVKVRRLDTDLVFPGRARRTGPDGKPKPPAPVDLRTPFETD